MTCSWVVMTTETGRRASRLELIRARLHESGRRCARDGDVTTRTSTAVRASVDRDVRPTGRDISHTTIHNGVGPGLRAADPARRGSRVDTRPDRKVQPGNMNHDRQQQVPVAHHTEVKGRSKLDEGIDRQENAQVRKLPPTSSGPVDRAQTGVDGRLTVWQNDSTTAGPRCLAQKTSSSSSLLSKSQNFFARLRNRKNDPSKATKSASRDGGSGNSAESNRKIRRSISESGCAMYANRELVGINENSADMSPSSAHLDAVRSSDDVRTEHQTASRPEVVDNDAVANSAKDHVTTTSVYVEVEPLTSSVLTDPDVTQPAESTSGSGQIGSCPTSTAVYEECSGSYSLREALLQRGGGDTAVADTPTSVTSSDVIRRVSATSLPQSDNNRVPLRKTQTSSALPAVGPAVCDGCRSMSLAGWRRRKLATTHSTGCLLGGRREGRLERIQEVDSPPGSADDNERALRSPSVAESGVTEQRVGPDATQRGSDALNCKFVRVL